MHFKTMAIHAGQAPDALYGAVIPPVYQTSTFAFKDADQPGEFDYARSGNPTRKALETCLAALEHGMRGFAFASGLAAESAVVFLCNAGDHIIASDELYGGTYRLLMNIVKPKGIDVDLVDLNDEAAIRKAIRPNTRMIWIESPTNPLMKLVDLAAIAALAKEHGILSVCDNTFLSPYFQNPLDFGIDIVVHSTTKYINGHSDVIGGAVVVKDAALADQVYFLQNSMGAVPGPWDCFLILRGLKTLAIRMVEHNKNAVAVAEWLEACPKVEKVNHPGLKSHPQHALALKQTKGHGATFSFKVKGGVDQAYALMRNLRLFSQAVSLGGVESLIEYPWTMTHLALPEPARREMGITENLLRVSIGLEYVDDLIEDLAQAFEKV